MFWISDNPDTHIVRAGKPFSTKVGVITNSSWAKRWREERNGERGKDKHICTTNVLSSKPAYVSVVLSLSLSVCLCLFLCLLVRLHVVVFPP